MNKVKDGFEYAVKKHLEFTEKILRLETPGEGEGDNEAIKFRREFLSPLSVFQFDSQIGKPCGYLERGQWDLNFAKNLGKLRGKFNRYKKRFNDLAKHFGFEGEEELYALEEYLLSGEIISRSNTSQAEAEANKYHPTRIWETGSLAKRVAIMRQKGMKYKEIAGYYNKIKPANTPTVTTIKLRQIISRAGKQLIKPQS